MKRSGIVAAVVMFSAMCAAQMMSSHPTTDPHAGSGSPHGATPSSRTIFGAECGLKDVSPKSAFVLSRAPSGTWTPINAERQPGPNDNAAARVWRETNWMVDLHDAPGDGRSIHTGQMCFDSKGQLTRMIDRYMDIPTCGCMRFTSLSFDASGNAVKKEQKFVKVETGEVIAAPEAAKGFPEVFGFRRLDQLPFYSQIKK